MKFKLTVTVGWEGLIGASIRSSLSDSAGEKNFSLMSEVDALLLGEADQ
jgi:hypothetical protein